MDRAQLEQMALEKISKMQTVPSSSFDRASLEQMALEKLSSQGMTPINKDQEASLGLVDRAKYSIEGIQSNRKAFLEQKYGKDNVLEKSGDLYINQDGQFLPVNKEGLSAADFADFAGATPEIAGTVIAGLAGTPAGPAGIMAMGAGGGAIGSGVRQGLSAIIGNPQVATPGERAIETGVSGAMGGLGAGAGILLKKGYQAAKPGITQVIKNLTKKGSEQVADTVGNTMSKTVANTDINLNGQIVPQFTEQTADNITGKVADQSGRDMVKSEARKLADIATREGLPSPTYAQAAQGKALIAEAKVMDTPLIGGKVRETVDKQVSKIKDNLESLTGKFIDVESDAHEVGLATREYAETAVSAVKKASQELYDHVDEVGKDAMIGKRTFFNKFRDYAGELGLIRPDLSPEKYAADTGLTRETFNKLQSVMFDGIDAIKSTKSDKIRFEAVNALRKTINASAEELRDSNPNAARLLKRFGMDLDKTTENVLNREHPELGEVFKEANKNWAKFRGQEETLKKFFKDGVGDEKVVKTIMSDSGKIESLKEIIGEKNIQEIGKSQVKEILSKLGKSGIGRADTALEAIRKQGPQIKAALGQETYSRLIDNLHFLNRTGQPLNVSRASLYNLLDNRGPGLKGLALNIAGGAKTLAESKGTTVTRAVKGKIFETTSKKVEQAASSKGLSNAANLLGDSTQRDLSYVPGGSTSRLTEREKEIERRKRAISGSK